MKTIVIVEQDCDIGDLIELYIEEEFQYERVDDVDKAIKFINEEKPCLVFYDVTQSEKPLNDEFLKIKDQCESVNLCIILDKDNTEIQRVKDLEVAKVISKPLNIFDVRAVVKDALDPKLKEYNFKKSKVLVIEESEMLRPVINSILRLLGFKHIQNVKSISEGLGVIEKGPIDWVISDLFSKDELNGFHLLKLCLAYEKMKKMKVSLIFENDEISYIPTAFELGLLSWMPKNINKDELLEKFKKIADYASRHSGDFLACAINEFRAYLKSYKSHETLFLVDQTMTDSFEYDTLSLLNYAESQFLLGHTSEAILSLRQAEIIDVNVKKESEKLKKIFIEEEELKPKESVIPGVCVIVDNDEIVCRFIKDILLRLKATDIHIFHDGEAANDWLKNNPEPYLIVMEWKLPKVTGPVLIQRIKQLKLFKVNILICSSLIQKTDLNLLKEVGVAHALRKPMTEKKLLTEILTIIMQDHNPLLTRSLEIKVRQLLEVGEVKQAKILSKSYLTDKNVAIAEKLAMKAEIAYYENEFKECKVLIMRAISLGGQHLLWINLLGKCLMQIKDFSQAAKCFAKAQEISPQNIERLCNLANMNSEMGDHKQSKDFINQAEAMDLNGDLVKETKVKVAFNSGKLDEAQKLLSGLQSGDIIVAYLNNQAIAFSQNEDFKNSINVYKNALKAIPKDNDEYNAIVNYNLALTYVKLADLDQALKTIGLAVKTKNQRIEARAKSLKERIIEARLNAKPLELNVVSIPIKVDKKLDISIHNLEGYQTKPGEACLYKIFNNPLDPEEALLNILNKKTPSLNFAEPSEEELAYVPAD